MGTYKGFKIKTDNKLRGAFGETDYDAKTVRISKKKHKRGARVKHLTKNKDGSENLFTTIAHELNHIKHPKAKEKTVERLARAMRSRMTLKQKAKIYRLAK